MFKWISSLGHMITDWLYENVLGSTAPSLSAKTSPEKLREIKIRIYGADPATCRTVPEAGSPSDGDGEQKECGPGKNTADQA